MATIKHETYDREGNLIESRDVEVPDDPAAEAQAVIEKVRDPKQPNPSVEDRLAAIECLLVPPSDA